MQPITLRQGDILKGGEGYVKLLSDVEVERIGNRELGSKGGKKRWEGKTAEEKMAAGLRLLEARRKKRAKSILPVPDPPSTVDESKTIEDSRKLLGQILTENSIQRRTEKEAKPDPALIKALTTLLPKPQKPQTEDEWADLDWEMTDKDLGKLTGAPIHIVQATRKQLMEMGRI